MKILVVTPVYPSARRPSQGTFVKSLVDVWRRGGADVSVLAPVSAARTLVDRVSGSTPRARAGGDEPVARPLYGAVSTRVLRWRHLGDRLSIRAFTRAVSQAVRRLDYRPDVIYAQFLRTAAAAAAVATPLAIPCVAAIGESGIDEYDDLFGSERVSAICASLAGVVAVSPENEAFVRRHDRGARLRYLSMPNAVDTNRFAPADQAAARKALGLAADARIVLFAGPWTERKGPRRLLEAIERLPGVQAVFLGDGPQRPAGSRVLFAGAVEHEAVPAWMSAADVFALPSLAEGMSNSILEAMASGLPIVVSNRSFNRGFIDSPYAWFVEPGDTAGLTAGLQAALALPTAALDFRHECRSRAAVLSIEARATAILSFLDEIVGGRVCINS